MCELQIHGSRAVIEAVSLALSKLKDFRPAEPGIHFSVINDIFYYSSLIHV